MPAKSADKSFVAASLHILRAQKKGTRPLNDRLRINRTYPIPPLRADSIALNHCTFHLCFPIVGAIDTQSISIKKGPMWTRFNVQRFESLVQTPPLTKVFCVLNHRYKGALLSIKEGARTYLTAHSNRIGSPHQWRAQQYRVFRPNQPVQLCQLRCRVQYQCLRLNTLFTSLPEF